MAQITFEDLSLSFRVRKGGKIGWKDFIVQGLRGKGQDDDWLTVNPLRNINLSITRGERVGILGNNGAGKSTMLKVLAGIYPPTVGKRTIEGTISSLFDLSLGFEYDATGWENIRYRGFLQGETPKSIEAKIDDIAEFTELGEFLDMPLRYYSAGMVVRLGFAIATSAMPEIFIVDEVLSAGDAAFQEKAKKRMNKMMDTASLVVLVSHDMSLLGEFCTRVLWMDKGRIKEDGPAKKVIAQYLEESRQQQAA
ncbi:MAG: ABC transporter ATP-binding protein [Pirellulaceae bacterium]|nr:ABC transporter ATP-binding protein [Pirellulaceae bacterium]